MTTNETLAHLRKLLDAATPGPWGVNFRDICQLTDSGQGFPLDFYPDSKDVVVQGHDELKGEKFGVQRDEDRDLIVAARNSIDALLAVAEAAAVINVIDTNPSRKWVMPALLIRPMEELRTAIAALQQVTR